MGFEHRTEDSALNRALLGSPLPTFALLWWSAYLDAILSQGLLLG